MKRHDNVAFMGGAHVFPGGRVDPGDRIDDPERICDGVAAAVARMSDVEPAAAVAHHVAAIRELFEEAGVLIARPRGAVVSAELRHQVSAGTLTLKDLAQRNSLRLALDDLVMFAHWVTPEIEIKRFDTRFFVARLPGDQHAAHDDRETIESEWMAPDVAVDRCRREEISLPPPTWTTLRMLSKLSTAEDVMQWARRRDVVRIQPVFIRNETETMLTLPGDPTFPATAGFETPEETRFILADGRWKASK